MGLQVYPYLKQPRDLAPYFGAISGLRDLDHEKQARSLFIFIHSIFYEDNNTGWRTKNRPRSWSLFRWNHTLTLSLSLSLISLFPVSFFFYSFCFKKKSGSLFIES